MEKQIREIIAEHVGGTYEAKQKCAEEILRLFSVVGRSEQLACDCDRQPLRYNEVGTCKYCGKQKPSEV